MCAKTPATVPELGCTAVVTMDLVVVGITDRPPGYG
jgi:hypothetical protein